MTTEADPDDKAEVQPGAGDEGGADGETGTNVEVNLEKLGEKITDGLVDASFGFAPAEQLESPPADASLSGHLEEIADDLLQLLKRVQRLEEHQRAAAARLDEVHSFSRGIVHNLRLLERRVVGDQKAMAAMTAFEVIAPTIDELRHMLAGLDLEEDRQSVAQLRAILSRLESVIRKLGFTDFQVELGDEFDCRTMEVAGHEDGEPNKVVKTVRPGYRAGEIVVRPAGVHIPDPRPEPAEGPAEKRSAEERPAASEGTEVSGSGEQDECTRS